jgi:hypothetical protein
MPFPFKGACLHKREIGDGRNHAGQDCSGFRALKRKQGRIFHMIDGNAVRQLAAHVRQIVPFRSAVHDQIQILSGVGHHQIVDNPTIARQQQRIAHPVGPQSGHVARDEALERFRRTLTRQSQLTHMTDVEQPGMLPGPQMLGHDAFELNRHFIAGEWHHPPPMRAMPAIERQLAGLCSFCGLIAARRIAPIRLATRLIMLVRRTVVDVSAHLRLSSDS